MMKSTYKVIVAHPHKQHSFQLATALEHAGVLHSYVTTVYNKKHSLTAIVSSLLKGNELKKAESRYCEEIPDGKVKQFCEAYGLLYLIVMRIVHNNKRIMDPLDSFIEKRFGKKLAKYAVKNKVDAVICYDTQSVTLFDELKKKNGKIIRILDVSAANLLYLKNIYEHDIKVDPEFRERLVNERPSLFTGDTKRKSLRIEKEIKDSNYFIVPSKFVEKSLLYSGAAKESIIICPYGIDLSSFQLKSSFNYDSKPLRFIYVGGIKQLKGIGHLLKAFSQIDKCNATLTVVGAGNINDADIKKYASNIRFCGSVLHSDIPNLLKEHDVFVFPSLGDSFGFAPLEAAAVGLPLILSENTGLSDYMSGLNCGFVVKPHSVQEIVDKVNWFLDNRNQIPDMGKNANKMACSLTIDRYYESVSSIVKKILEK